MQLKLYKNFPINDYANQCYYSNESQRDSDFDSYTDRIISELASCDKSKREIRLDVSYYVGNQYNYGCIIENNKRYYIFIDSVEWKSNLKTCVLHYSYDYWQTYCYEITLEQSYVEREHVSDDTFGKHIIDEGLPVSDYKIQSNTVLNGNSNKTYFCIACADWSGVAKILPSEIPETPVPSVIQVSKNEFSTGIVFSDNIDNIKNVIDRLVSENKIDSIVGFYAVPSGAIPNENSADCYLFLEAVPTCKFVLSSNGSVNLYEHTFSKPNNIDGYTPINNKCFCYPYCGVNVTNNNGNSLIGKFEFSNNKNSILFNYHLTCIEGSTSFGFFKNYDGVARNFDYSIQGQSSIELPYVTNTFSAYMSANQNAIANQYNTISRNEDFTSKQNMVSLLSANAQGLTSLAMGNLGGFATAIGADIDYLMAEEKNALNAYNQRQAIDASIKDVKSKGNVAHGSFIGNGAQIVGDSGFKGQIITVTSENIKMIDEYFTMFGYKVNTIKKPQFNSRPYWNYIKTSGVNLIGNVPQNALNIIKQMFDNGVTMWHKTSYFYKYSQYKSQNVPQ